ncbi:plasmid mobilization protein MobA [Leclercia adecarboxylata]|uniref:plasmid mobilization protein MobA n=1 Tax=Leclercia adecarboxylata TaxID=83655 RepID=UPI0021E88830|nr:plasmid mobilization protein MobA [Leclercia adecarboxylata]MCV3303775.1 nikA protein [Leclercia adecarboxylata]MCV3306407.1 nikA protein [Leclercia adecarboxylata]
MSDKASRRGSEKRQKTIIRTVRFTPVEIEQIEQQAELVGQSVSAFIRNAAMNRKVIPVIDDSFLTELLRLGRLQKHHFVEGKRTGDKEYSIVLVAITELANTLRKQLLSND